MIDNLMKGAGKQAINMFLKAAGGPQNILKSFKEILIKSEPQMLKGIESKTEQYKKEIEELKADYLQYTFKPFRYKDPNSGAEVAALVVHLIACKKTESGVLELRSLEKNTIENFFNSLLNAYIENGK